LDEGSRNELARGVFLSGLPHHGETLAHYRLRAIRGRPEVGLVRLDKLDRTLGRRSARKKATG